MSQSADFPSRFVDAVRSRAATLAPGWSVSVDATDSPPFPVKVLLTHPLSNGHQVLFTREHVDAADLSPLNAHVAVASNEFAHIARAPICPHARLLRDIRGLANAYDWPLDQVAGLAGILSEHDALTPEEFEWLREGW